MLKVVSYGFQKQSVENIELGTEIFVDWRTKNLAWERE